jgi:hypothetical protein
VIGIALYYVTFKLGNFVATLQAVGVFRTLIIVIGGTGCTDCPTHMAPVDVDSTFHAHGAVSSGAPIAANRRVSLFLEANDGLAAFADHGA